MSEDSEKFRRETLGLDEDISDPTFERIEANGASGADAPTAGLEREDRVRVSGAGDRARLPSFPKDRLQRHVGRAIGPSGETGASLALRNLRGIAVLGLVTFHSVLPYLWSARATVAPFDQPPYTWRAFPVVDAHYWFGFDLFSAWQDVYLMALMFFLSGLFAWPSLVRKGSRRFLADRTLRLVLPFVFCVAIVVPLGLYPVYRLTAIDPGLIAYIRHFLALPLLPNGPAWFLWLLMAFTIALAGLQRFAPEGIAFLSRWSSEAAERPGRWFIGLTGAAALAYIPLAYAFTPWNWADHGLLSLQLSRPLLYCVYFFAGVGVGAHGLERGLVTLDGRLARRWSFWFGCALASLLLWMGLTGITLYTSNSPLVRIAAYASFALAGASGLFFVTAASLRFVAVRMRALDLVSKNALGIYLLHYAPLVWLQYALLDLPLFSFVKAALALAGTLALSFAATVALRSSRFGARLIGEEPPALANAPSPVRVLAR